MNCCGSSSLPQGARYSAPGGDRRQSLRLGDLPLGPPPRAKHRAVCGCSICPEAWRNIEAAEPESVPLTLQDRGMEWMRRIFAPSMSLIRSFGDKPRLDFDGETYLSLLSEGRRLSRVGSEQFCSGLCARLGALRLATAPIPKLHSTTPSGDR